MNSPLQVYYDKDAGKFYYLEDNSGSLFKVYINIEILQPTITISG